VTNTVNVINAWFDILNSSQMYSKKKLQCGYSIHLAEQVDGLRKMIKLMEEFEFPNERLSKQSFVFINGEILSSHSLLQLFPYVQDNYGVQNILTMRITQDCLQNFFSLVRGAGGSYSNPTPVEALHRIKLIILGKHAADRKSFCTQDVENSSTDYNSMSLAKSVR